LAHIHYTKFATAGLLFLVHPVHKHRVVHRGGFRVQLQNPTEHKNIYNTTLKNSPFSTT